ncbi:Putative transposase DNA-binding domain protein [uncultured archaeon]|nr:Putative transposase DNA-binding domain protein [uncultured archaeon]
MEVSRKVFCSLKVNEADLAKLNSMVKSFEDACNYASEFSFRKRIIEAKILHDRVYRELRVIFKLPAALAVRAIQKVASSYRESSYKLHIFKERSLTLDRKLFCLKRTGKLVASIATASGRIKAELKVGDYQRSLLRNPVTGARLILKRGVPHIQICVACDVLPKEMDYPVGVDLGTRKLLVASNGFKIDGRAVNAKKQHFRSLKNSLKEKGTSSAKRRLKRLIKREKQWFRTTLHQSSRALVESLDEGNYLVLERLYGTKVRRGSKRNRRCTKPSFQSFAIGRLHQMISYKCGDQGIPVILAKPDFTSQRCPRCGTIDKFNRRSQALFRCVNCGYQHNADFVASINLRELALGGWAAVSQPNAVPPIGRDCKSISAA